MISTWRFKGHALSSVGSKRNHTSIRTLEPRSSRSEIRMDITLRSVRCLQAEISMAAAEAGRSSKGYRPLREDSICGALTILIELRANRQQSALNKGTKTGRLRIC